MKYYTVKEIAEILMVNEETVRRWIRNGTLKAERGENRRHGSKVDENVLKEFVLANKGLTNTATEKVLGGGAKVAAAVGGAAALGLGGVLLPGVAPIAGALIGGTTWLKMIKKLKESPKSKKEIVEDLKEKKIELESIIMALEYEISTKQSELKLAEENLKQLKNLLDSDLIEGGENNEF